MSCHFVRKYKGKLEQAKDFIQRNSSHLWLLDLSEFVGQAEFDWNHTFICSCSSYKKCSCSAGFLVHRVPKFMSNYTFLFIGLERALKGDCIGLHAMKNITMTKSYFLLSYRKNQHIVIYWNRRVFLCLGDCFSMNGSANVIIEWLQIRNMGKNDFIFP